MGIGENIRKFRIAHNMEQKELGKALNVSDKTISSWECGRTEPKMGMIQSIAELFGVETSDIIEGRVYNGYDSAEEFEQAWHKLGGGKHPNYEMEYISSEDHIVIEVLQKKELHDHLVEYARYLQSRSEK